MSDIDDDDFLDSPRGCGSTAFLCTFEPPGTPPSAPKTPSADVIKERRGRRHQRSLSEQIFSKARLNRNGSSCLRERLTRSNKLDDARMFYRERLREKGGGSEGGGENLGDSLDGELEYKNRFLRTALYEDFSPFERPQDVTLKHSTSGYSHSATNFKNALKRTVKKVLSSSRAVSYHL